MSEHTEGPWKINGTGIYAGTKMIAWACLPYKVDDTRNKGESWLDMRNRIEPDLVARDRMGEANARLIAAAPELLECAQELCNHWESPVWKETEPTAHVVARLKAAIAKATGAGKCQSGS